MKLRYDCRIYDKEGQSFTVLAKDTEIDVVEVDKRTVKIQWKRQATASCQENSFKTKFGFISHRQFIVCVDIESTSDACENCSLFGNCGLERQDGKTCFNFTKKEI